MEKNIPKFIIFHCTDVSYKTLYDQFLSVNTYHRDERKFPKSSLGYYVGYHRLITGDKNYQARLDTDVGAHCNQHEGGLSINFQSLGVCIGFDGDIEFPLSEHYTMLQKQIWDWQDQYNIPNENVRFHRYYAYVEGKTCPGSLITDQWLKDLLTRPLLIPIPPKLTKLCTDTEVVKKVGWWDNLWAYIKNYFIKKWIKSLLLMLRHLFSRSPQHLL